MRTGLFTASSLDQDLFHPQRAYSMLWSDKGTNLRYKEAPEEKTMKPASGFVPTVLRFAAVLLALTFFTSFKTLELEDSIKDQWSRYNAAVVDSAIYRHENLRPLTPLAFEGPSGTTTMVTLTDWNYPLGRQTLTRDIWVTAVPEVQKKCRSFKEKDLALRLRQLLGLQPEASVTNFVTMEVTENDIFRPALNPVTVTEWPCGAPESKNCGEVFPDWVSDRHVRWITNQMLTSYMISTPPDRCCSYPWTRLGYTYDWKPGSDRYGASEYVVRAGSPVNVTQKASYTEYCKANPGQ